MVIRTNATYDGSQFVTLYNKENKLTYEKIVYKDTGKTYIGSWSSNVIEYDRFMSQQADFIVDQAFTKAMADEIGKTELMITMLLSPNTGEVMEVNFNFSPLSHTPKCHYMYIGKSK